MCLDSWRPDACALLSAATDGILLLAPNCNYLSDEQELSAVSSDSRIILLDEQKYFFRLMYHAITGGGLSFLLKANRVLMGADTVNQHPLSKPSRTRDGANTDNGSDVRQSSLQLVFYSASSIAQILKRLNIKSEVITAVRMFMFSRVHNSGAILRKINPIHTIPPYFPKIHFIFPSTPSSSEALQVFKLPF
jgi:hypothetical protein